MYGWILLVVCNGWCAEITSVLAELDLSWCDERFLFANLNIIHIKQYYFSSVHQLLTRARLKQSFYTI